LRDDARERYRQVVTQRQIRLARGLVLTAAQALEDQLVALFTVLAEERLDVFEGRGLEGLEAVSLVHAPNDANDILPPADVGGQKVAGASGWLNVTR
jgi:hypothetical protein